MTALEFKLVKLDFHEIADRADFHRVSASKFGFPDFYGHNMHAWIDCMRALRNPREALSEFTLPKNGLLHLELRNFSNFLKSEKELALNILYSIGEVNSHCVNSDGIPLIIYSIDQ